MPASPSLPVDPAIGHLVEFGQVLGEGVDLLSVLAWSPTPASRAGSVIV